jgi:hypothetical protein
MRSKIFLLIIVGCLAVISARSQFFIDSRRYNNINDWYRWPGGTFYNNLNIPKVQATTGRDTGGIRYSIIDSTIHVWTGSQWRALGGGGSISDGDKGDITVSSSGTVWTIDNLAVTNAKINDVVWSKITGTPTTILGYGITDATLNTVTTNGNFTNNEIRTGSGGFGVYNTTNTTLLGLFFNVGNNTSELYIPQPSSGKAFTASYGSLLFTRSGYSSQEILPYPTPSGTARFFYPDAGTDRTIPISVNGVFANTTTGDIPITVGVPYTLINGGINLGSGTGEPFVDTSGNKLRFRTFINGWNTKVAQSGNNISYSVDTSVVTLTFGTTTTWDASLGLSATVTLTGDGTLAITNMPNGVFLSLKVLQDGTGGHDFNAPSGTFVINGKTASTIPVTSAANSRDVWTIWKVGNEIHLNYGNNYTQ